MNRVIRSLSLFAVAALVLSAGFDTLRAQPAPPQPSAILAVGGGTTLDGHYAMTGTFGVPIAQDTYSLTSTDTSTKAVYDPLTKKSKRVLVGTVRTGVERVLIKSGPLNIAAHVDGGVTAGGDALVGAFSGGGTITYDLPKHPNLFAYGTYRAIRSPSSDPASNSTMSSAVSIGIGLKLYKTQ